MSSILGVLALSVLTMLAIPFFPQMATADVLVVKSTAPSVNVGTSLANDYEIVLVAGESMTVRLPNGRTRTLTGPTKRTVGNLIKLWNEGIERWVRELDLVPEHPGRDRRLFAAGQQKILKGNVPNDCGSKDICTPILILFGTNRKREDIREHASFGAERDKELTFGSALVTVPIAHGRGQLRDHHTGTRGTCCRA